MQKMLATDAHIKSSVMIAFTFLYYKTGGCDNMTIKDMRTKTRLSQHRFSKLVGIPAANIARWEQGRSKPPVYVEKLVEEFLKSKRLL